MFARLARGGFFGVVAIVLALQVVPYGRDHANPSVRLEPQWNSPETRVLAVRACFDCHSNETLWPWYSNVAPVSWLVQRDVEEGRRELNFSEWDRPQEESEEAAEKVEEGEMPPGIYLVMHPEARLAGLERRALLEGLQATLGGESERDETRGRRGRDQEREGER